MINGNELTEAEMEAEFIRLGRWDMLDPRPQYDTNTQEGITTVRAKTIVGGVYDDDGSNAIGCKQVGGNHYVKHCIQPWDIIDEYNLDYYEGCVLKYLLRDKDNRKQDLEKAIHCLEKIIGDMEDD